MERPTRGTGRLQAVEDLGEIDPPHRGEREEDAMGVLIPG